MKEKIGMFILWIALSVISGVAIWLLGGYELGFGEAIAGGLIAIFIEKSWSAAQDLLDSTNWKTSQRMLKRGGYIKNDTIIRISFAYLYRIKIADKYLLVPNARNTGKYQPVGGVYKLKGNEKLELKRRFQVKDDNKILIDESSRDDYRMRIENRYLRSFIRRFDRSADRERVDNIGREFREELVETGILNWSQIQYRFCGRHMTELKFGDHFQIYELMLADIVELMPTSEQEKDLRNLMNEPSEMYRFAAADEISSLGIDTKSGNLVESIGEHTKMILEESEGKLMKAKGIGEVYTITLSY